MVLILIVAIHNKNGQGLLHLSLDIVVNWKDEVAIHNKNGQGLLLDTPSLFFCFAIVAIHNKNGQGLLPQNHPNVKQFNEESQSTIKMDKGYYSIPI